MSGELTGFLHLDGDSSHINVNMHLRWIDYGRYDCPCRGPGVSGGGPLCCVMLCLVGVSSPGRQHWRNDIAPSTSEMRSVTFTSMNRVIIDSVRACYSSSREVHSTAGQQDTSTSLRVTPFE